MTLSQQDKLTLFKQGRHLAYRNAGRYASHIMFKLDPAADIMDLYQEGCKGLWRILELDKYDPDRGAFEPYAAKAVEIAIRNYVRDKMQRVKVPRKNRIVGLMSRFRIDSIDEYINENGELWPNEAFVSDEDIEEDVERLKLMEHVTDALWELEELDREIIKMSFGIDVYTVPLTQDEIAEAFGLSQADVSRRVASSMQDLADILYAYNENNDE